jgi:putative hydrolase of the HAD superfamily
MKEIKHIFFDLDNTLWDFEKNSREALLHLFTEHGLENKCGVDFAGFLEVYEAVNHELWHLYSLQQTTKAELRYRRFYKAFLHYKYDDLDMAHCWADAYLKISPYKTHLVEGSIEVLNYLKQNYVLHLITNGFKEVQHIKLDSCGLTAFFDQVIISEDHGVNKPDVKIFELAEKLANVPKSQCVMIGDNYDTDIVGAVNAGWKAIHLTTHKNEAAHYISIGSLSELFKLF